MPRPTPLGMLWFLGGQRRGGGTGGSLVGFSLMEGGRMAVCVCVCPGTGDAGTFQSPGSHSYEAGLGVKPQVPYTSNTDRVLLGPVF